MGLGAIFLSKIRVGWVRARSAPRESEGGSRARSARGCKGSYRGEKGVRGSLFRRREASEGEGGCGRVAAAEGRVGSWARSAQA